MKFRRTFASAFFMSVLALTLAGCQEREGPAEKAGKEIDKAASALGEQIERAGEQIQGAGSSGN